ncbi:hypothetical protein QR680_017216 [Steinernema hermaphroditum]|uniref:Secreted protein n=1 Tax=Steinernema hermaphroditum TaxID=289476 RepID=A0AA39LNW3_9BILA|nr:hypothetical protein QR680_017216 [Steinernema hermaphroditum]
MLNRRRFHLISTVGLILRLISFPCRIDSSSLRCFIQFVHHLLEIFGRFCDECDVVGEPCRKTYSSVASTKTTNSGSRDQSWRSSSGSQLVPLVVPRRGYFQSACGSPFLCSKIVNESAIFCVIEQRQRQLLKSFVSSGTRAVPLRMVFIASSTSHLSRSGQSSCASRSSYWTSTVEK